MRISFFRNGPNEDNFLIEVVNGIGFFRMRPACPNELNGDRLFLISGKPSGFPK
jgi:hypothetical protein